MAGYLKDIERKQGAVVLMHDLTAKAVEKTLRMIPELMAGGYSFTNLEDLRSLEKYKDTFFEVNK